VRLVRVEAGQASTSSLEQLGHGERGAIGTRLRVGEPVHLLILARKWSCGDCFWRVPEDGTRSGRSAAAPFADVNKAGGLNCAGVDQSPLHRLERLQPAVEVERPGKAALGEALVELSAQGRLAV
jgi:hypothetical protein